MFISLFRFSLQTNYPIVYVACVATAEQLCHVLDGRSSTLKLRKDEAQHRRLCSSDMDRDDDDKVIRARDDRHYKDAFLMEEWRKLSDDQKRNELDRQRQLAMQAKQQTLAAANSKQSPARSSSEHHHQPAAPSPTSMKVRKRHFAQVDGTSANSSGSCESCSAADQSAGSAHVNRVSGYYEYQETLVPRTD